jgi:hypothetical protein
VGRWLRKRLPSVHLTLRVDSPWLLQKESEAGQCQLSCEQFVKSFLPPFSRRWLFARAQVCVCLGAGGNNLNACKQAAFFGPSVRLVRRIDDVSNG